MKITPVLKDLIVEQSRFKVLYDKLILPKDSTKKKGVMPFETLKRLIFADPTTRFPQNFDIQGASVNDMEKVKVGKYSQWIVKNFLKPLLENGSPLEKDNSRYKEEASRYRHFFIEDLYRLTESLKKFEKIKNYLTEEKRDINVYTVRSLSDMLRDPKVVELLRKKEKGSEDLELKKKARESRKGFEHAGGEIIFEGNDWTVIKISDTGKIGKDAAIWYGGFHKDDQGESSWCTSSPGLTYFEGYIKDGPLYVIFPHDDKGGVGEVTGLPTERYQFHFPSNQFKDVEDHEIDKLQLFNGRMSELKPVFKEEFYKKLFKDNDSARVMINYPHDASSIYVALYGFDDLFKILPTNIRDFVFDNKESTPLNLDLPEEIGRFTELEILQLSGVVKSLPSSMGNLKNLEYLSLTRNPLLGKLPDALSDLPNLSFVLTTDSPKVVFPEKLRKRLFGESKGFFVTK